MTTNMNVKPINLMILTPISINIIQSSSCIDHHNNDLALLFHHLANKKAESAKG
jgi:hypothetical protein